MRDRSSGFLTHHVQNLKHGVSAAIAAIEHMAEAGPGEEFVQGEDMHPSQVADMDIVPNPSSVRSGEVITVDCHFRSLADRHFDSDLD
jgi:hypothetical protein